MKKSYFLYYGSHRSKDEIKSLLTKYWDIVCISHENYYSGLYYLYSGFYADKLTVKDNQLSGTGDWLDEDNKQF